MRSILDHAWSEIEHEVVYRSAGPLHVQIRPAKSGFVAVGYPRVRTDPPELVVTDVEKREVRTLKVLAPPEMARLALRYAEERNDGSFVASGAWVEKGQSRNGVIRISEEGRVVGGSLPAALGADWLASAWDQNAGLYVLSPAAAVAEEVAGAWLVELLGLPPATSVGFVTGATMANFTALAPSVPTFTRNSLLAAKTLIAPRK